MVDAIDWMEEPLPSQNVADSEESRTELDTLNMPALQWPGKYVPPKSASKVKIKWRRNKNGAASKEADGFDQETEYESEEDSEEEDSGKFSIGGDEEDSEEEDSGKFSIGGDEEGSGEEDSGIAHIGEVEEMDEDAEEIEEEKEGEVPDSPKFFEMDGIWDDLRYS